VVSTRRFFLSSLAIAGARLAADKGQLFPSEVQRYPDSATELDVFRLTDPAHISRLPAYFGRAISRHGNFLIYSSDRTGTVQAYRMDWKTGQSRILTETDGLVTDSLTLGAGERDFCFLAGRSLFLASLNGGRAREVYRAAEGFDFGRGFSLTQDGLFAAVVEQRRGAERLRLITMRTGGAETLAESADPISDPEPRPGRAGLLYRRGEDELWVVNFDGAQNRRLKLESGGLGPALWSEDGRTILYLNFPSDRKQLNNVREFTPDTNEDRFLSATSQFVAFNRNADSSVLVGASGSKASPYLLLLVRSVRRELTLCEHGSSDPRMVAPMFSPNSQRVFFQSDRHGKMAIYSMAVDRLVADTETDER
jgi:oligogalacturonide lyase